MALDRTVRDFHGTLFMLFETKEEHIKYCGETDRDVGDNHYPGYPIIGYDVETGEVSSWTKDGFVVIDVESDYNIDPDTISKYKYK